MGFFDKIRVAWARFMSGRYGADQLSMASVVAALVITIIGSLTGWMILTLLADVLLIISFIRMFSKDRYKRAHENQMYLEKTYKLRQGITERVNRFKNRKKFRYFTCPQCKSVLRVPRGVGNVTITCKKCGNRFEGKA